MEKTPNVRFIRKNGRIIPIFSKEERKRRAALGSAQIAGGIGVAATSGFASGKLFKSGVKNARRSKLFSDAGLNLSNNPINDTLRKKATHGANRQFKRTKLKFRASKFALNTIGFGLGSSLAGVGITNITRGITGKERNNVEQTGDQFAGVIVSQPVTSSFKSGVGSTLLKALSKGKL